MQQTVINQKWTLYLPEHRAERAEWWDGWEKERLDSMSKNIHVGDIVYDIGAEEGDLSALYASWLAGGAGGICLFEPNPRVWPNIKAIWEANRLANPLATWVGFAGDETTDGITEGPAPWPSCADGEVISDHGFCNLSERPDIPAIKLDDFASLFEAWPDVITIDTEGSEFRVLQGAVSLLGTLQPLVYVSVHPEFMAEMYGDSPQMLYEFMGDLGYRSKHLVTDHEEHWVFWHPYGRELVF